LKAYDSALDHDPKNALALYNRGRLSEARGDDVAALAHYRRLLALPEEPRFESARAHARASLQQRGGARQSSSSP
jgi:tetratricopeptide (TPR) repeat protein